MPNFRYRALTEAGEIVSGAVSAPHASEVAQRIAHLGLIPIETFAEENENAAGRSSAFSMFSQPRAEDLTIFTGDLALLLRTGARINDALEMLATDADIGRMRPTIAALAASILAGESFGEALAKHPAVFPPIYVALVKVGEASGTLAPILEALSAERQRSEALRRRLADALRYPAFLLLAAGGVMLFFLTFVLPQFANVFRDFNTKLDPVLATFLALSDYLRSHTQSLAIGAVVFALAIVLILRQPAARGAAIGALGQLPLVKPTLEYYRTSLFCRNLGLLLSSGVPLPISLRILSEIMTAAGGFTQWSNMIDKVRQGGRLSEALTASRALPPMAVRTLRLGEDSGQLPMLSGRVAEFYEAKLQRSLDRMLGIVGPLAIMFVSTIVGGLIVSVMTALISVNEVVN
ncbi:MAG TPA: type II secretion system F family protein [Roseiarcus sp.]|jgi:general secretion pathway protein F